MRKKPAAARAPGQRAIQPMVVSEQNLTGIADKRG